ncbi:MAG: hypothetical protein FWE67_05280 [Planctomycetaceae bacterium]|nr:hypothetical protein [Planctomycetaceae bacterium]
MSTAEKLAMLMKLTLKQKLFFGKQNSQVCGQGHPYRLLTYPLMSEIPPVKHRVSVCGGLPLGRVKPLLDLVMGNTGQPVNRFSTPPVFTFPVATEVRPIFGVDSVAVDVHDTEHGKFYMNGSVNSVNDKNFGLSSIGILFFSVRFDDGQDCLLCRLRQSIPMFDDVL